MLNKIKNLKTNDLFESENESKEININIKNNKKNTINNKNNIETIIYITLISPLDKLNNTNNSILDRKTKKRY